MTWESSISTPLKTHFCSWVLFTAVMIKSEKSKVYEDNILMIGVRSIRTKELYFVLVNFVFLVENLHNYHSVPPNTRPSLRETRPLQKLRKRPSSLRVVLLLQHATRAALGAGRPSSLLALALPFVSRFRIFSYEQRCLSGNLF